jgi:3-hydroxyisobutyrate dehydrogenase-like beta-hydroxyacid dehydrogenase
MSKAPSVGFIGLGIMGDGMSRCLLNGSPDATLNVWNRSPAKTEKLTAEFGADRVQVFATPAECVAASDLTFLMLSTPEASAAVYPGPNGVLGGVSAGKMLVDCATLRPQDMIDCAAAVEGKGGMFLEAPVSGSKGPAETGTLIFLASGDKRVFHAAEASFDLMGKAAHFLDVQPGSGTKMKLVVNGLMANMLASLGESLQLAKENGIPADTLIAVLGQGAMANPMFAMKGPAMIKGGSEAYPANFPLKHALKDLAFSIDELDSGPTLAISTTARTYYKNALDQGMGDLDFAAVAEVMKK